MSKIIALAGKGGTGKTTIAALIVKYLVERKQDSILAIDADPNSNLGEILGVKVKENMGQIIEDISKNPSQIPAGYSKDHYIEYKVQESIVESDGFDILTMGLPEGPGCYCYANNVLRGIVSKLVGDYKIVVIDNEAGMEHLSRRTTRRADYLLIISDYTKVGINAAKRIYNLSKDLNLDIKNTYLFINQSSGNADSFKKDLDNVKFDKVFSLPFDKDILEMSAKECSILNFNNNSKLEVSVRKIAEEFLV